MRLRPPLAPASRSSAASRPALASVLVLVGVLVVAGPLAAQDTAAPSAEGVLSAEGVPVDSLLEGVDYLVYDREGNPSSLRAVVAAAASGEVLLVGEEHDDMVGHEIEAVLLDLLADELESAQPGRSLVLSMEMFERDVQYVLDEYLADLISEDHFLRSSRPWDDYEARYRPLIETAKTRAIPVVAANAPRRYVSRVTSHGRASLEALSDEALRFLPPLPYPGPSALYREQWDAVMEAAMADYEGEAEGRNYGVNLNAIHSQALWDAAMGHAVTQALVRHVGDFVVHFAGSFHVEKGTGIPERIVDYRPGTRVTTMVMTKVDDVEAWSEIDHGPLADFAILTRLPAGGPSVPW